MPIAEPWGACGIFTKENKIIREYPRGMVLKCGGPRFNPEPKDGYRHIIYRHRDDFKRLTSRLLMNRTWRDLADYVMYWTIKDPD
ncbi:MAG: hypothetical protein ACK5LN_14690, partial [Propioniciclava sp.]